MTPEWPSTINYLAERGGWSQTPNEPVLRSEFDYGPARARRRFTRQIAQFSFSIKMSEDDFIQFEGFYHDDLHSGVDWFIMPVYLGRGSYEEKRVRFMEPYQVKDAGFRHVIVSSKMEVNMQPIISGGAVYFLDQYGEAALFDLADALDPIVNIQYPEVMENY